MNFRLDYCRSSFELHVWCFLWRDHDHFHTDTYTNIHNISVWFSNFSEWKHWLDFLWRENRLWFHLKKKRKQLKWLPEHNIHQKVSTLTVSDIELKYRYKVISKYDLVFEFNAFAFDDISPRAVWFHFSSSLHSEWLLVSLNTSKGVFIMRPFK